MPIVTLAKRLRLKGSKCFIGFMEVEVLGSTLSGEGRRIEDLLKHISAFQELLDSLDDNTRPPRKLIRRTFVNSLPDVLKDRIELREPRDFDAAIDVALDELDELLDMLSTLPERTIPNKSTVGPPSGTSGGAKLYRPHLSGSA